MTWHVKLLNRPELPDSLSGDLTYEAAERIVSILESGRFDEQELEEAMLLVPGLLGWDSAPEFKWQAIGRQLPVPGSGTLDILASTDVYLQIRVIELKAGEIRRADLAQARDYALALEEMEADDLAWLITTHSGRNGVPRIWDPQDLAYRIEFERAEDKLEGERWPGCMVIGRTWRPNVTRLARELGVELRAISELCKGWRKFDRELHNWKFDFDDDDE